MNARRGALQFLIDLEKKTREGSTERGREKCVCPPGLEGLKVVRLGKVKGI